MRLHTHTWRWNSLQRSIPYHRKAVLYSLPRDHTRIRLKALRFAAGRSLAPQNETAFHEVLRRLDTSEVIFKAVLVYEA